MASVAVLFIHQFCNTFIEFVLFALKFVMQFVCVKEAMLPSLITFLLSMKLSLVSRRNYSMILLGVEVRLRGL